MNEWNSGRLFLAEDEEVGEWYLKSAFKRLTQILRQILERGFAAK